MKRVFLISLCLLITAGTLLYADSAASEWGAAGAKAEKNPSVADMLKYAIEDEYLARAEYNVIMKKFGKIKPFSNIVKAEERHIQWLKDEYTARKISIPDDLAPGFVAAPDSLTEALEAGVKAEIDNIAMYQSFLDSPKLKDSENAGLKDLFTRLMQASENHLAAFKRNLGKN